jgi:hypothetical protein
VSGPDGDTYASLQLVAVLVEDARHLKQRRVPRGVVPYAFVPGIEVTVEQDVLVGLFGALDKDVDQGAGIPSLIQLGSELRSYRSFPAEPRQLLTVRLVDGEHRDLGFVADVV